MQNSAYHLTYICCKMLQPKIVLGVILFLAVSLAAHGLPPCNTLSPLELFYYRQPFQTIKRIIREKSAA